MRHGNCKRFANGFDSDLCDCGCAAVEAFATKAEIADFMRDAATEAEVREAQTNVRALAHARAVNARARAAKAAESREVYQFIERFVNTIFDWQSDDVMAVSR